MDDIKRTYIYILLDGSGSMSNVRTQTIAGVNEQIATIRKNAEVGEETLVSFATFNHEFKSHYRNSSVNFLEDLTDKDYVTAGGTSIYDAVGTAIMDFKESTDSENPNNSYLVIVVTDGMERCSKQYTKKSLAKLSDDCHATERWTITYLGNQRLGQVARDLHIPLGNMALYASDAGGSAAAWRETSGKLDSYLKFRKSGVKSVTNFHNETSAAPADYTSAPTDCSIEKEVESVKNTISKWRQQTDTTK